jgi:outer membrane protein
MLNKLIMRAKLFVCSFFLINGSYAFDLMTAYEKALEYNADYLASVAQNKSGQEKVIQGRAALLPQISATGQMNENYLNANGAIVYYNQPTLGISLSQTLYDFGKFSQYTKSKYATQVADLQLANAKSKLIVTIAQSYFDVLYAEDSLNAIKMTKDSLEKQLNQAKKSFDVGTVTIADVNDAQSGFDTSVADEIKAQNDYINKKNIFQNLTGLDPNQIQPLTTEIALIEANPVKIESWSYMARSANFNIKIADKQLQMATEDIGIAKAGHLPSVNIIGSYNNQGALSIDGADSAQTLAAYSNGISTRGSALSSYSQAAIGVQVNIPLYNGGTISSQVRQSVANYENSMQQLVSTKRQTDQDVQNAYWQVENGINLVKAQTQSLKSAFIKLKSDKIGYQIGLRNSVDLVNSQKNYYQVLQNYNQARYQYLVFRLQLMYLIGSLDIDFLKTINTNIKTSMENVN